MNAHAYPGASDTDVLLPDDSMINVMEDRLSVRRANMKKIPLPVGQRVKFPHERLQRIEEEIRKGLVTRSYITRIQVIVLGVLLDGPPSMSFSELRKRSGNDYEDTTIYTNASQFQTQSPFLPTAMRASVKDETIRLITETPPAFVPANDQERTFLNKILLKELRELGYAVPRDREPVDCISPDLLRGLAFLWREKNMGNLQVPFADIAAATGKDISGEKDARKRALERKFSEKVYYTWHPENAYFDIDTACVRFHIAKIED
jgi:hypothetical protein